MTFIFPLAAMKKREPDAILYWPLEKLKVSKEFTVMTQYNDLYTLSDILQHSLHQIPYLPFSNYRMLRELLDILERHSLEYKITD